MALTTENYQSLDDAGLVELFDKNRSRFAEMAQEAYSYTSGYITPTGQPIRVDDVAQALVPALNVSEVLTTYLASNKLRQKYWPVRFADLVLDRLWEELNHATATTDEH